MADRKYDILFEPIAIGPKTLKNRFYQVPHCTGFGRAKPWSQARHRSVKAEGGWAAVCTEFCAISPESDEAPYPAARLWDEGDVKALSLVCEEAHVHGALAGVELHHGGVHAERRETRVPAVGPSQIGGDFALPAMSVPKEMDADDIERVKRDWVTAAVRAREAGFDIVYVYGGHTYLLGQFLSPYYNKRTDAYGGSLENRARLWLETLDQVKAAIGNDCAIAVRLSVDTPGNPSVGIDDVLGFVEMADELVDLWDLQVGGIAEWSKDSGASRFFKEGFQFEWTRRLREQTQKPIVGVGRLVSPDLMVDILKSGCQDLIGAARPSIADPFLPNKIAEGRFDEIRECIGCNACTSRAAWGGHLGCTQNATAGEEYRRGWHPEVFTKAANSERDVLVVGAGPAGMECATVLGKRGMVRVHLVEASEEIGGCVRWISQLPGLGEWARLVNYRRIQMDKLRNIEVLTANRLSPTDVLEYGADLVVVASGSRWSTDGVNCATRAPIPGAGADKAYCLTPEQIILENKPVPGRRVLVYDCDGYYTGPSIAEHLVKLGHSVDLVTCLEQIAPLCTETLEGPILRHHLHSLGVAFHRSVSLLEISEGGAAGADEFGDRVDFEADAIVLVTQRVSEDSLYRQITADRSKLEEAGIKGVYSIGDCVAPRPLADAVFDGHRLGREIDSDNPAEHLPYLREEAAV